MSTIVQSTVFADGNVLSAANLNQIYTDVKNVVDANIDNSNISSGAAIAGSKHAADAGHTAGMLADSAVTTAKVNDDAITAAKMQYGMVKDRQGGATGDASWQTQGTSNTDTSAKGIFLQAGSKAGNSGADVTVTFPTAYNQVPLIFAQISTVAAADGFVVIHSVTTTGFTARTLKHDGSRTGETFSWLAVGQ